jgi:hypothetical protein
VHRGEDDVARVVEPAQVVRRAVAAEDVVPRLAQPVHDGLAADQADFALGAGSAVEDGDFHVSTPSDPTRIESVTRGTELLP